MKKLMFALTAAVLVQVSSQAMQPRNFSWVEEGKIAGMACPATQSNIEWLKQQNIGLIISLTEEPLGGNSFDTSGIEVLHLPIKDFCVPTKEQIDNFIQRADQVMAQGKAVVAHCRAGIGRTGTILACWLAAKKRISGDDAIAKVRQLRPHSVETAQQEKFVRDYAASLGQPAVVVEVSDQSDEDSFKSCDDNFEDDTDDIHEKINSCILI